MGSGRMSIRRVNALLWGAAAVMCAAAVGVVVLGIITPVGRDDGAPVAAAGAATRPTMLPATEPSLAAYQRIWELKLRPPLNAAVSQPAGPVVAAAKAGPQSSGLSVTLVGTVGNTVAMLKMPNGDVQVKRVGETAAGAKLVAVRPAQADLQVDGRVVTLRKVKEQ